MTETKQPNKYEERFEGTDKASILGLEPPRAHAIYTFLVGTPLVSVDRRRVACRQGTPEDKVIGDHINFKRISDVFLKAFASSFRHCPVDEVIAGRHFAEDLYYNFDGLPWKGSMKTQVFTHNTLGFLGSNRCKEYKIILTCDEFLSLEPELLGLEPWYIVDGEDLAVPLKLIFDFARAWFSSEDFEFLAFVSQGARGFGLEFYHAGIGVVLTVQFEVGFPEGGIDPSWYVSRKKKVK